jgi:tetratricopeptide (TPR) repeat protein
MQPEFNRGRIVVSPRLSWCWGIALLLLAQGCSTPRIRIEHTCPPCIPLDPHASVGLELVIDPAAGQAPPRPEAAEMVRSELERHLLRGPYPLVEVTAAKVIVRATPTQWTYEGPLLLLPGQNGLWHLRVRIEVIPANSPNAPCIASSTYWSKVHALNEGLAIARAADMVADRFLDDLRPSRICNVVQMDDTDPRVQTGIQLCECGQFDAAYSAFSDLAARAPDSPPVLYDLAVLKESRGEYDEAEALLLRATKMDPKGVYYIALERVRAARHDAEALGKTP